MYEINKVNRPNFMKVVSYDANRMILENSIKNTIVSLKYLETPVCRAALTKDSIISQRKTLTVKFRTLLTIKESLQNIKAV
jgi:hypothetical protein